MIFSKKLLLGLLVSLFASSVALGENPLVTNIFTADPSARVFNGRLYVYTSHDLPDATYWDMVDWRLLSTDDLATWKDHGSIFRVKDFGWASRWAWAPDCVELHGKYYLFLPVDRTKIGVAVGDHPEGPFKDAIGKPLIDNATLPDAGPEPIDPAVFQDDDGQAYLYFGCRYPKVVKLRPSLTELDGGLQTVSILDSEGRPVPQAAPGQNPVLPEGYGEGPFVFKRAGKYYFIYSNGWAPESTLVYAIGDHPMGPFTYAGKVMEHVASVTQHGCVVQFKGRWYVLYHTSELSNGNNFRRSVCIDELRFDANGRINTVTATKSGPAAPLPPIALWPGVAPGETNFVAPERDINDATNGLIAGRPIIRLTDVHRPTITVYRPPADRDTGAAVVVCPGGGYSILALDLEGTEVCEWLNSIGVTGVLLKYRVPTRDRDPRYAAPLQDAQRAFGIVRRHAAEWGLDPRRIGVLGFSAGGHLSAALCAHAGSRTYAAVDECDRERCRPDFQLLIYPGGLVRDGDRLGPEVAVTTNTPPTFLVMAEDDPVRVENVLGYTLALKQARVPAELHVYASGGHGYGLRRTALLVTTWPERAAEWMKNRGLLERTLPHP
jgi:acetyl esterase/lipase